METEAYCTAHFFRTATYSTWNAALKVSTIVPCFSRLARLPLKDLHAGIMLPENTEILHFPGIYASLNHVFLFSL